MDEIQYAQTVASQEYEEWLEQQDELARQQMVENRVEQDRKYLERNKK